MKFDNMTLEALVAAITSIVTAYGLYQKNITDKRHDTLKEYKSLYQEAKKRIKELEKENSAMRADLNVAKEKIKELEAVIHQMEEEKHA